jgi:glycosyltransferase involved in cell wall biosynthesis
MKSKILIYIVSYQRMSYTQGTIKSIRSHNLKNVDIIVCDNGSTDGTREWLEENKIKYSFKVYLPETNLRVGGAWTYLTTQTSPDDYDFVILLDNDGWIIPKQGWLDQCLRLFDADNSIVSLGLQRERRPGFFSMEKNYDHNYETRVEFEDVEIYNTVFYAAFRMDRFRDWYEVMSNWSHKFIGEKLNVHYNMLGKATLKINPGYVVDISEYNFNNPEHENYNIDFYNKERDQQEYNRRLSMHSTTDLDKNFIIETFGSEYLKYI